VLRQDIFDLARESLSVRVMPRKSGFQRDTQAILERLALTRMAGGPLVSALVEASLAEIAARVLWARSELERAVESKGLRHYGKLFSDLAEALDELCDQLWNDVDADFGRKVRAAGTWNDREQQHYELIFTVSGSVAIGAAKTELKHFAEQLRVRRDYSTNQAIQKTLIALGAALATAVATFFLTRCADDAGKSPTPPPTHQLRTSAPSSTPSPKDRS
jgi:hypothetical protein